MATAEQERRRRDRKWLIIFIGTCAILVFLPNFFGGNTDSSSGDFPPQATAAYVINITKETPEVGILTTLSTPSPEQATTFSPEVEAWRGKAEEWSQLYSHGRVPPDFILSVIQVESGGNPYAESPLKDSQGLFQIWERHLEPDQPCAGIDPFNPDEAASCAIPLMDEAIQSATLNGQSTNYLAAAVGYHQPQAIQSALGLESSEAYAQRMNGLGHNGDNLLASALLYENRIAPYLRAAELLP